MRIGVNTRLFRTGRMEGVGWHAHEVIQRLVRDYPEVDFVFFFDGPAEESFLFGPNVQPVSLIPPARHPLLYLAWFEWSLPPAMRRYGVDLYFSPEPFLSLRSPVPAVTTVHDIAFVHFPEYVRGLTNRYYHHFFPRYFGRAQRMVAVSEYTRQDVVRHYGVPEEKILLGCNGCREVFRPLEEKEKKALRQKWTQGHPYFCYVGSIHPRKNVANLLRAFERFKQRSGLPHRLVLAGRMGWHEGETERAYRGNRFREHILLTGYQEEKELARILASSEGLAYPSRFEGFGVPLLEAMHSEVPILTSRASSLPEVAGEAALLVEPESVEDIAGGLQQLATQPNLREQLVAAGREQRQHYSWERAAQAAAQALGLKGRPATP